jgi:acetyltransferase-like isoleucine patch superfamily enzyme
MAKYRDGFKGGIQKYDFSLTSISRIFLLLIIPILANTIALTPIIWSIIYIFNYIDFSNILHIFILSLFLVIEFFIFIILFTLIPGFFIKILRLKVEEGEYEISIKDWNFFKFILFYALYRPALKIVEIFPLLPLRLRFLKLVGLKIGKSSILTGTELINEPFLVEIGEQTLIGGHTNIASHITEEKLVLKKIIIGDNCLIGGYVKILCGVIIEDDVTVGLNSVVLKNNILKKGRFYAGIPAKEKILDQK